MPIVSLGRPVGPSESTCGYCSPPGRRSEIESSKTTAGLDAIQLSSEVYQGMIDRGWRRSGTWCYKPNMKETCCPQYTIKLDALLFKPSRSQRQIINRWNRFISDEDAKQANPKNKNPKNKPGDSKSKGAAEEFILSSAIHDAEASFSTDMNSEAAHKFEVTLEPSVFTHERYALYQDYQQQIHHDFRNTPSGFKRFLVDSPLRGEPIPYSSPPPEHLPFNYGSYHQLYRVDGKLVAMSVLDILPTCVSSVYFVYDKAFERFSFGKLSALREISLAREIHEAGAEKMNSLYMGFYIHSCPKMKYKGEYSPSFLADPETYAWHPLEDCIPLLDKHRYACFSNPEHSLAGPSTTNPGIPPMPTDDDLNSILMVDTIEDGVVSVTPVKASSDWQSQEIRSEILSCIDGLGIELSKKIIFNL